MVSAGPTRALLKLIRVRILIFALSTLACITLTILYIVILTHGWTSFLVDQRAIVLILVLIYGISSMILYLMMVLGFRPWDGVRIAFLVLFQAGGTAVFFVSRSSLPCTHIGPESTCKQVEGTVVIVGWLLSSLLLTYALFLAIMSFFPKPEPPPDLEAALAPDLDAETSLVDEKRLSAISDDSDYSQSSYNVPATRSPAAIGRSQTIINSVTMGPNYYRTGTHTSVHSIVPSIHYPTNVYLSRVSTTASSIRPVLSINGRPQKEPILRRGTPLSVLTEDIYDQQHPRSLTPSGVRGRNPSELLPYDPNVAPHLSFQSFSIPPSPSPQDLSLSFNAPIIPAAPMPALLPAQTDLPMNTSHGRRGVHDVRRYGSVSDPHRRSANGKQRI